MPVNKPPKIAFWNAQGIANKSKQQLLNHFISIENIDILLLAETFLKPHNTIKFSDFIIHRNDRLQQTHGGVAIMIRKNINHKVRAHFNTKSIENISIEIQINNRPVVVMICHYSTYTRKY